MTPERLEHAKFIAARVVTEVRANPCPPELLLQEPAEERARAQALQKAARARKRRGSRRRA